MVKKAASFVLAAPEDGLLTILQTFWRSSQTHTAFFPKRRRPDALVIDQGIASSLFIPLTMLMR
jgi:hypothetical protein